LYATIGPEGCGGIMLSGHTDVVPIDGQDWDSDPWTVVERDNRLYGRGTCDMKSFVALVLAQVPDLVRRKLHTPVHLAFS
ncbi:M20/M25/M40 family metallo-hydrolase, partial [Acinetobacter baumannii]